MMIFGEVSFPLPIFLMYMLSFFTLKTTSYQSLIRRNEFKFIRTQSLMSSLRKRKSSSDGEENPRGYHIPVMVNECLDYLKVKEGGIYIDCTMGGGGHSLAILQRGGRVIGLDQDPDAIKETSTRLQSYLEEGKIEIIQTNFRNLMTIPTRSKLLNGSLADGILMDLGISSHQIDENSRGFSFSGKGPLDMRMHQGVFAENGIRSNLTAEEIVNTWNTNDLANLLYRYGEETRSRAIAREIVLNRPLNTTHDLEKAISKIASYKDRPKILARCFQALRIYVNDELGALEEALRSAENCLKIGGRLVILSYHSLEDRRVKQLFKTGKISVDLADEDENDEDESSDEPQKHSLNWKNLVKRGLGPKDEEVAINKRSRSAKLRAAERIDPTSQDMSKNSYPKIGKKQLRKLEQQLQEQQPEKVDI